MVLVKKIYFSLFILLSIVLLSCSSGFVEESIDNNDNLVIKEWYNEQDLKSLTVYLNEDKTNYIYASWFKDGKLKDSAKYINDTIEGLRKFYEEAIDLMHIENYSDGLLNGVHKAVYNNGVTSFEGYRKNNWMVGEWRFHFRNGNPITYEYYDSVGKLLYFRKYDDDINVLKETGKKLIDVSVKKASIDLSESCSGFVEAAIPPGNKTILSIQEVTPGQDADEFFINEMEKPKINWERKFETPGTKKLKFILKVKDKKSGKEEIHTFEQNIEVSAEVNEN